MRKVFWRYLYRQMREDPMLMIKAKWPMALKRLSCTTEAKDKMLTVDGIHLPFLEAQNGNVREAHG